MPLETEGSPTAAAGSARRRLSGAFLIPVDEIEPDPNQPRKRINDTHLGELTQSVKELGVLQPISVRFVKAADRYRIISGECRFTAARKAGLSEIPCWVKSPDADTILLEQIVENWQRSDLNPFELADSLAILRDANGLSQRDLAQKTGKSAGEISKIFTILDLDPAVQRIAREDASGRISKRHLYSLARLPVVEQPVVLERIASDDLTAADTDRLVQRLLVRRDKANKGGAPVSRRRFLTKHGNVVFTFRKKDVTDEDMLATLREVKLQIMEQAGDPADFQ